MRRAAQNQHPVMRLPRSAEIARLRNAIARFPRLPVKNRPRRPIGQALRDLALRYDVFISFAHADGEDYAIALYDALRARPRRLACFIDAEEFRVGDDWREAGYWALRRTRYLVLVGSAKALQSEAVQYEVAEFCRLRRARRRLIPIDFARRIREGKGIPPALRKGCLSSARLGCDESEDRLTTGPSAETLKRIEKSIGGLRQDTRVALLVTAGLVVLAAAIAFGGLAALRHEAAVEQEAQRLAALSQNRRADNPIFDLLLAAHSLQRKPTVAGIGAVRSAMQRIGAPSTWLVRDHEYAVDAVAFSPDGRLLAAAATGNSNIELWELDVDERGRAAPGKARRLRVVEPSDGRVVDLAFGCRGDCLLAATDEAVELLPLKPRIAPRRYHSCGAGGPTRAKGTELAVSPDGDSLAAGLDDNSLCLWKLSRLESSGRLIELTPSRASSTQHIDFSPDGKRLATGGYGGLLHLIRQDTGNTCANIGGLGEINAVRFNPVDGRLAVGNDAGRVQLLSLQCDGAAPADNPDTVTPDEHIELRTAGAPVTALAFDASGTWLAVANGDLDTADSDAGKRASRIELWRVGAWERPEDVLGGHRSRLYDIAFRPGRHELVSAGNWLNLRWWWLDDHLREPQILRVPSPDSLAFIDDDSALAVGAGTQDIWMWTLAPTSAATEPLPAAPPEPAILPGHAHPITALAAAQPPASLVSADLEGNLLLWRPTQSHHPTRLGRGHGAPVYGLTVDTEPGVLLSADELGKLVRWRLDAPGQNGEIGEPLGFAPYRLALGPRNDHLIAGGFEGELVRFQIDNPRRAPAPLTDADDVPIQIGWIHALAFDATGSRLAIAGEQGGLKRYDFATGAVENGPTEDAHAVAYHPPSQMLIAAFDGPAGPDGRTAYARGILRLWPADASIEERGYAQWTAHRARITELAFDAAGARMATAGHDDRVLLWHFDSEALLAAVCRYAPRRMTPVEKRLAFSRGRAPREVCIDRPQPQRNYND
jgi:WD40 repeat protein